MTPSPRRVARKTLALAPEALPAYSCPTRRPDYTQPPLCATLALMVFLQTDDRGVGAFLHDFPELPHDLGLPKVPPYSTLNAAERRLLPQGGAATSSGRPSATPACAA